MTKSRLIACLMAGIITSSAAQAGNALLQAGGGAFSIPVKSRKEMRWATVVRQQYDFSCGSGAVATLLTFHYDMPVREDEVFQAMFSVGDQRQIRAAGFSMLDMKRFLDTQGLRADGFRMTLDKFAEIGVPGITLIDTNGYRHFVVVKGIEGDRVLIGDPALGTRILARKDFEGLWSGAVLAARESVQIARAHFNERRDWRVRPKAPVGQGIDRKGLGMFTLTLPGRHQFGR